jgi:hypothetical protein
MARPHPNDDCPGSRGQFLEPSHVIEELAAHAAQRTAASQHPFVASIRKFGISKAELGVVSHGLRHQYANDHFEADAGGPSPVRGGTERPHGNKPARKRVSRVLGHNRERASTAYLGSDAGLPEAANDPAA